MEKNNAVKPLPLISEILPGFTTVIIISIAYGMKHAAQIADALRSEHVATVVAGAAAGTFVLAWIVGTFLDNCRDLIEWVVDFWWPLNWDYLTTAPAYDVERLHDWYGAYYFLAGNYVMAGLLVAATALTSAISLSATVWWWLVIVVALFGAGATLARFEMRKIMGTATPHAGVFTRLQPSSMPGRGVGVVAIRPIKKGTYIFEPDDGTTVRVAAALVDGLPSELKGL